MQSNSDLDTTLAALDHALAQAIATADPSVVRVSRPRGSGSGIVWAPDLVVTSSFHTPDDPTVAVAGDGGVVERAAQVVGRDPGTDVAVLRVDGGGLAPIARRSLDGLAPGHLAFALARPGNAIRASLRAVGVIGPTYRTAGGGTLERYVETDRALPRGFGGGPLVDRSGRAIGMNTRTLVASADLCVPVATVARVVEALVRHGRIARGYLGVGVQAAALPPERSDGRGRGALVVSLEDGGPAAAAGVLVGDVILAIDATPITGPDDLRLALADRPEQSVTLDLERGGTRVAIGATVGVRP